MYAVIETGGKQYRVQPGDLVQVEKLDGDVGSAISFSQVLFCSNANAESSKIWVGKPYLSGAKVEGQIVGQGRGDKVIIVKMKRRKQYRRTQGHRQFQTEILITDVSNGAGDSASLPDNEKQQKLSTYRTPLKPKGEAFSQKLLGSRKRRIAAYYAESGAAKSAISTEAGSETKATAKKKAAPKAAAKKTTAKKK